MGRAAIHDHVTPSEGDSINISLLANLVTIVVGGVGVPVALYQLSLARRARQHELANIYIQRFWDIDDARQRATIDGKDNEALFQDRRYVRLCEDEFEIARLGFLDPKTWAVWHSAIRDALQGSRSLTAAGPDELVLARRCRDAAQHEPSACPAIIGRLEPNRASKHRSWLTRKGRGVAARLRAS